MKKRRTKQQGRERGWGQRETTVYKKKEIKMKIGEAKRRNITEQNEI